jgi:hypothetical protein
MPDNNNLTTNSFQSEIWHLISDVFLTVYFFEITQKSGAPAIPDLVVQNTFSIFDVNIFRRVVTFSNPAAPIWQI